MRLFLTTIILTMLAQPLWADTTNRAKQFSPAPGVFVGGVGLECRSKPETWVQFVLLTKDRKKLGIAKFEDDDVIYDLWRITKTTPRHYIAQDEEKKPQKIVLDRQKLEMSYGRDYWCDSMSISDLHNNAGNHLRALLSENKI